MSLVVTVCLLAPFLYLYRTFRNDTFFFRNYLCFTLLMTFLLKACKGYESEMHVCFTPFLFVSFIMFSEQCLETVAYRSFTSFCAVKDDKRCSSRFVYEVP